jgi:hypothetical protein
MLKSVWIHPVEKRMAANLLTQEFDSHTDGQDANSISDIDVMDRVQ